MLIHIIGRGFRLQGGEGIFFAANAPIILYVIVYTSGKTLPGGMSAATSITERALFTWKRYARITHGCDVKPDIAA